jgi:putative ABC transport system ATP-binding protein
METYHSDAVRLDSVHRTYGSGGAAVAALNGISIGFPSGSFTAVMGPSGSGKSTFLQCAAGLDSPTSGTVTLGGQNLAELNETQLTKLRRRQIGFIFQAFNLLPALTVEQNVTLPLTLAGKRPDRRRTAEVIAQVGLSDRARHRPAELSGGQQQRVAIARALAIGPTVLFADEPTGALDTRTAADVLGLLRHSVDATGQTVVLVTHDPVAAAHADRVVFLADGRFVDALDRPTPETVAERMTHLGELAAGAARFGHVAGAL